MAPVPMALLIDDCAPVNNIYWEQPWLRHELIVPNSFTRRFADVCLAHGVRGKFTVLPIPGGMGRIDQRVQYLSPASLAGFLDIVRKRIVPNFDISPEILTHGPAYRLEGGGAMHVSEDTLFATAAVETMTDYIALALQILCNVGLPATGVTSPWVTGREQETNYAKAIGLAQWRVNRRKQSWYFLHMSSIKPVSPPTVTWRDARKGLAVVSIDGRTGDWFWRCQSPSAAEARAAGRAGVDAFLTADGRGGRLRELFEQGGPITLVTHWQSLFSNGRQIGLDAFEVLLERIDRVFGKAVRWVTCGELMRDAVR